MEACEGGQREGGTIDRQLQEGSGVRTWVLGQILTPDLGLALVWLLGLLHRLGVGVETG